MRCANVGDEEDSIKAIILAIANKEGGAHVDGGMPTFRGVLKIQESHVQLD
jgi:hypothetical protein